MGHGPFSHVFEKIIDEITNGKYSHESISKKIINEDKQLKNILGNNRRDINELLDETKPGLKSDIISGSLDADKLDYLRRDSYSIGAVYGMFDLERIIHNICSIKKDDRKYLGVDEKGA